MLKPRSEINHTYYAKRTANAPKRYCSHCAAKLRADCDRLTCTKCWRKTDEGKLYMKQKKAESRAKK